MLKIIFYIYRKFAKKYWILQGCPVIKYNYFDCGLCGSKTKEEYSIPTYESLGEYWDTIGICSDCLKSGNTS